MISGPLAQPLSNFPKIFNMLCLITWFPCFWQHPVQISVDFTNLCTPGRALHKLLQIPQHCQIPFCFFVHSRTLPKFCQFWTSLSGIWLRFLQALFLQLLSSWTTLFFISCLQPFLPLSVWLPWLFNSLTGTWSNSPIIQLHSGATFKFTTVCLTAKPDQALAPLHPNFEEFLLMRLCFQAFQLISLCFKNNKSCQFQQATLHSEFLVLFYHTSTMVSPSTCSASKNWLCLSCTTSIQLFPMKSFSTTIIVG